MNHKFSVTCCIIGAIILTIMAGCGRKSKDPKVTSETKSVEIRPNQYCRAIVNTKDGYSTWVTFEKDKTDVTATRHWGNIIKVDDRWVQLVKRSYLGKRKDYEMVFLKDLKNGLYNYLSIFDDFLINKETETYSRYCFSYSHHYSIDDWEFSEARTYVDLNALANSNDKHLIQNEYNDMITNEAKIPTDELRNRFCEHNYSWMVYQDKPKYEFICEAENLSIKIHILETVGSMITLYYDVNMETCLHKNPGLSNLDTIVVKYGGEKTGFVSIGSHTYVLYTDEEKALYKKYISSGSRYIPHGLFLFTQGATHRRTFGVSHGWKKGVEQNRVALPELPKKMQSMLKDIDRAPDGCGYFDWETADLVNRNGQRYHVADYESMAGVYWLGPDEIVDASQLDPKPEGPVVVEQDFTPPDPRPNCEFFTEKFQHELEVDKLARKCGCNQDFKRRPFRYSDCTSEAYDWYNKYYYDAYDGSNFPDDDTEEDEEECGW